MKMHRALTIIFSLFLFSYKYPSTGSRRWDNGGGGGREGGRRSSRPLDKVGWAASKNVFSPSGLSQCSKNKGTLGPPGPSPGSATVPSGNL